MIERIGRDNASAIAAWNTRATPPAPAAEPTHQAFEAWAKREGYDTANTYDTERSLWVWLNPMTADLWRCWQFCASLCIPEKREPLTVSRLWENEEFMALNATLELNMDELVLAVRIIERAHGITPKEST